jgi:hypothetical protein
MAGSRCAEDAVLADEQLLDAVCCADFGNQLCDFGVPVATISTNDQEGALDAFGNGEEDAGNESLAVVFLLEDLDLLPQTGAGAKPRVSHDPPAETSTQQPL